MSAKTIKPIKPKAQAHVAKSKSKSSLLNKRVKFNWKIAAVIGIVLIAALGYLFVRMSRAQSFGPDAHFLDFYQHYGTPGQKDSIGIQAVGTMNITEDPNALFYYAMTVNMGPARNVTGNPDFAYIGLQYRDGKKKAIFSVWNGISGTASPGQNLPGQISGKFGGEGTGWQTMVDYPWVSNVDYRVKIRKGECSGDNCYWFGSVIDPRNNYETYIGKILAPYGALKDYIAYFHEMYSPPIPADCVLPRSVVVFKPVVVTTADGKIAPIRSTSTAVSPKCQGYYQNTINGNTAVSATRTTPGQLETSGAKTSSSPTPAPAPANPATKTAPAPSTQGICEGKSSFSLGSQGGCVTLIQARLRDLGYMQASQVDGNYGDTTKAAVTKFQERNGLAQDGVVGVATWNKLQDPNAARKQ